MGRRRCPRRRDLAHRWEYGVGYADDRAIISFQPLQLRLHDQDGTGSFEQFTVKTNDPVALAPLTLTPIFFEAPLRWVASSFDLEDSVTDLGHVPDSSHENVPDPLARTLDASTQRVPTADKGGEDAIVDSLSRLSAALTANEADRCHELVREMAIFHRNRVSAPQHARRLFLAAKLDLVDVFAPVRNSQPSFDSAAVSETDDLVDMLATIDPDLIGK